jgi:hypothetical protein
MSTLSRSRAARVLASASMLGGATLMPCSSLAASSMGAPGCSASGSPGLSQGSAGLSPGSMCPGGAPAAIVCSGSD